MVCTGNICRSPIAEQVLRARLKAFGVSAEVHSAGSRAVIGHGMTPEAEFVARRYCGLATIHEARQLTQRLVASADLVLTATREHRSTVVGLHPRAARYCYTLNQFSRLLGPFLESESQRASGLGDDVANLRDLVAEVAATRGFLPPPVDLADDDIEDPYRQAEAVYDRVGVAVDVAVTAVAVAFARATGRR